MSEMEFLFSFLGLEWGDWGVILFCTIPVLLFYALFKSAEKIHGSSITQCSLIYSLVYIGVIFGLSWFISGVVNVILQIGGSPSMGD